jgi:hypothetical protein
MAPGFDLDDYEDGKKEELSKKYPEFRALIEELADRRVK